MSKMGVRQVSIHTDFIRLDQFLKLAQLASGGGEAKWLIQDGAVQVNGTAETRRGRKLRVGDRVAFQGEEYELHRTP